MATGEPLFHQVATTLTESLEFLPSEFLLERD